MTGFVGDRRHRLAPDHRLYRPFAYALERQDGWSLKEHRAYWEAHLDQWPNHKAATSEVLAHALRLAKQHGLDDEAAAVVLGFGTNAEDLARQMRRLTKARKEAEAARALALAEEMEIEPQTDFSGVGAVPDFNEMTATDYVLPRIYVVGGPPPDQFAYPNLSEPKMSVSGQLEVRVKLMAKLVRKNPDLARKNPGRFSESFEAELANLRRGGV